MNTILRILLPFILPLAVRWANHQIDIIGRCGRVLYDEELSIAREAGVQDPEAIKVLVLQNIPKPNNLLLRWAGVVTGLFSNELAALTFGHSIYLKDGTLSNQLLAHEFRHVEQYEAAGSIRGFLERYCCEMVEYGYENAPMEVEAKEQEAQWVIKSAEEY